MMSSTWLQLLLSGTERALSSGTPISERVLKATFQNNPATTIIIEMLRNGKDLQSCYSVEIRKRATLPHRSTSFLLMQMSKWQRLSFSSEKHFGDIVKDRENQWLNHFSNLLSKSAHPDSSQSLSVGQILDGVEIKHYWRIGYRTRWSDDWISEELLPSRLFWSHLDEEWKA